jgi:hypothetical protein
MAAKSGWRKRLRGGWLLLFLAFGAIALAMPQAAAAQTARAQVNDLASLRSGFQDPPADCRIMMRWWWFGPSVTRPELERELETIKQGGIGGVEVQPVYPLALDDPAHDFRNFPYLSDEFIGDLRFAAEKARSLGLRFDLTLGSGWPFGGPHIPVTEAAGKLRLVSSSVAAGTSSIAVPHVGAGENLLAAFFANGEASKPPSIISLQNIQDGRLRLPTSSQGSDRVLWFIASRTGQTVKRPAIGAEGFVLDHFDGAAIENHLHAVGDRLMQAFPDDPPYAVFSDSLEVYGSDWTGDLLEQFRQRRGYDLTPYLPALQQDIGPETADIRHDWGETLSELAGERYLTPIEQWAQQHHTRFRSQSYGIPPVTLSSNRLVDLPEGEGFEWRGFTPTRWASSASHLYGKNITSSETWTWLHSPAFRATPLDMKAEADLFFLQGINQLIGHGWPYSPPQAGEPGWRFYAAAVFNQHNPWWLVMPDITRYLQRVSYTLRQGKPVNDVAVLLPTDDAFSQFTLGHDSVSEAMEPLLGNTLIPQILDAGFNFDFIDSEAIARLGIHYPVLVLPGIERIPAATYRAIEAYAQQGGIVIATRTVPSQAPGLHEDESDTPQIREISNSLFQSAGARGHLVRDETQLGAALAQLLKPDVSADPPSSALGFVHRRLASADVYFLANTGNRALQATATFRGVHGGAQWWDPFTGDITSAGASATIALHLEPYESRILIFPEEASAHERRPAAPARHRARQSVPGPSTVDLSTGWTVSIPRLSHTIQMARLHSWTDDEALRYYSGEAVYERDFEVPASFLESGLRVWLDFGSGTPVERPTQGHPHDRAWIEGPVREAARVYIDGEPAGDVWKPPYTVELSSQLQPGTHHLKVVVGNTAINTLAGHSLPDYRLLNDRYGERFVAQDMDDLQPLPSGLLGPVTLVARPDQQ